MRLHCKRVVNDLNTRAGEGGGQGRWIVAARVARQARDGDASCTKRVTWRASSSAPTATLDGAEFARSRDHNYSQLNAYFFSIGGGTDQIQRNIIGERILGLPKEPEVDRDVPFREVRGAGSGA